MSFYVGQRVVCVRGWQPLGLSEGSVYTISGWGPYRGNPPLYDVAEVKTKYPHAWKADRFRPLIERKTSIAAFQRICDDITNKQPVKV